MGPLYWRNFVIIFILRYKYDNRAYDKEIFYCSNESISAAPAVKDDSDQGSIGYSGISYYKIFLFI